MKNTIEYKGYIGSVQFVEKDRLLYGKLLGIKALISYEGASVEELLSDFHHAVDEYLEYCKVESIKPEKPFKGSFNIRISPEKHKKLSLLAIELNQTLNSLVEDAIDAFLSKRSDESCESEAS